VLLLNKKDIKRVLREAKESADLVVAFPHWGANYAPVSRNQRRIAERLIAGGADAVLGHHGHAAQEFGMSKGKPVLWGLGNLFFGSPGRFGHDKMQPGYGLIARMVVKGKKIDRFEIVPIMLNNRLVEYQPRLCTVDEAERVLATLFKADSEHIELHDGIAVFRP
jgi:poly-gamma-glutamate capsule biosynthesis protein CapA/YwtB (metallophosphatase superfamily)